MTIQSFPNRQRLLASMMARDAIRDFALDLADLAELVAERASSATLPSLEKGVDALRASVLSIGMTLREAEAAEQGEPAR